MTGELDKLDTRPLSQRTRDGILAAIKAGAFPNGRLPREEEVALLLGVSRTTVRAALQSLESDGVVSRRRSIGTVVNEHLLRTVLPLNRLVPFVTMIEQAGRVSSVAYRRSARRPPEPTVAKALGIAEEVICFQVDRLFLADGKPAILVQDTIPPGSLREGFDESDLQDSTFDFAARHCVAPIDHATVEIVPRGADAEIARELGLRQRAPLLRLLEVHYTQENHPLAFSRIDVNDEFVRLMVLRRNI